MKYLPASWLLCAALLAGCGSPEERGGYASGKDAKVIVKPGEVIGPYSPAVKVERFLFVSGQIGLDPDLGELKSENIEVETRQVLDNLMQILRAAEYDSSHVVSATVYLKNMNDYARMNAVYGGYFPEESYPARVTVEVGNLPKEANVEIAVVAYK